MSQALAGEMSLISNAFQSSRTLGELLARQMSSHIELAHKEGLFAEERVALDRDVQTALQASRDGYATYVVLSSPMFSMVSTAHSPDVPRRVPTNAAVWRPSGRAMSVAI